MNFDYAEQRLVSIGFPLDAAFSLCQDLRKNGTLDAFVTEQEREYRAMVRREVEAVIG